MDEYIIEGISNGGSKNSLNQDACFAGKTKAKDSEVVFAAVCDGMGGMKSGELASATIIEEARNWFYSKCDLEENWVISEEEIVDEWRTLLIRCNERIIKYGNDNGIRLGSTSAFVLLWGGKVLVSNVGDTRVYEIPENGKMRRLSMDHSVVGKEIASGKLTEEEAKKDKRNNILTQCVGFYPRIDPYFYLGNTPDKGMYLITSDGFYNKVNNDEIVETLNFRICNTGETISNSLKDLVIRDRNRGERDDITVVAVRVDSVLKEAI